jgi:hypothetical protein
MRRLFPALGVCLTLLSPLASATAHRKKGHQPIENSVASAGWFRYPQFTDAEVRLVVNWFQDTYEAGRRHVAALPGAIRGQLHRGATLTAAAMSSLTPPPQDLLAQLPPMPQGYERMLAGPVLLILKTDSRMVVDTLTVGSR